MTATNAQQPAGTAAQKPPETAVATTKPPTAMQVFRGVLDKMKPQIALALPSHLDPSRMLRIVLTTVQRTPALLDCTRDSLLGCIVQCAQLGLEPDGLLGHAYLIPYKNRRMNRTECQLIVGYKGLIKLARQSGEVANVAARIVYDKDLFEYEYGLHEVLRHKPYVVKDEKDNAGLPVFAYAVFWLKDGSHHFEVMGFHEIERIREAAPSGESDAWMNHWGEMAKKTVLRRASKMSPASVDDKVAKAVALDERAQAGLPQNIDDPVDLLEGVATPAPADPAPSTPFVMSTVKQHKDLAKAIAKARVAEADVLEWFEAKAVEEMSRDQVDEAIKRLTDVAAAEAPIS